MATQIRGDALKEALRTAIREMAKGSKKSGKKIDYSALAKAVGTSRTTLYKMREFIDECLLEAKVERRLADGSSERKKLDEKVDALRKRITELEVELEGMRRNHVELYRRLYANSSDLAALIKPVVLKASTGSCILCEHKISANKDDPSREKIVPMIPPN